MKKAPTPSALARLALATVPLTLTGLAAAQETLHVAHPQANPLAFASIQAAIDAASPGARIYVAAGTYTEALVIEGKSLELVGHDVILMHDPVADEAAVAVRGLGRDAAFVMRGFDIVRDVAPGVGMRIEDCAGRVQLEDVALFAEGAPALEIERAFDVLLVDTLWVVKPPIGSGAPQVDQAAGARFTDALVHAYRFGARGADGHFTPSVAGVAPAGGDGLVVENAWVRMMPRALQGGAGGTTQVDGCQVGAAGGAALRALDGLYPSYIEVLDTAQLTAGASGAHDPGCSAAPEGAQALAGEAAFVLAEGEGRWIEAQATMFAGESLTVQGQPGEFAVLALGQAGVAQELAGIAGYAFLAPHAVLPVGALELDALGRAAFVLPEVDLALVELDLQALHIGTDGQLAVGAPRSVTLY